MRSRVSAPNRSRSAATVPAARPRSLWNRTHQVSPRRSMTVPSRKASTTFARAWHEWTVFKEVKLPEGKVVIPGVLDSTTNFIEHPELVAQRLVRYGKL